MVMFLKVYGQLQGIRRVARGTTGPNLSWGASNTAFRFGV